MTDTTYSYVTCLRQDAQRFLDIGYAEEDPSDPNRSMLLELVDYSANYGNCEKLRRLAGGGIVFHSRHEGGAEYGPCLQASDGHEYVDVEEMSGCPVARVMQDGRVSREDVRSARQYWRVYGRACRMLGENEEGP